MTFLLSSLSFGFLGSLHCVGMCGGFAGTISIGRKNFWSGLLAYQAGRILTYTIAGFLAGLSAIGLGLLGGGDLRKVISILAGTIMILMGLNLTGLIPDPLKNITTAIIRRLKFGKKIQSAFSKDTLFSWFGIGVINGLLPCGLVYAALFMAISSPSILSSALVMTFFGLGTIPAMMFAPSVLKVMTPGLRLNTVKFTGILLILFGLFTAYRGMYMKQHIHNHKIIEQSNIFDESCNAPK